MRKTISGFWWLPTAEGVPALVVTAAFFTLGGLWGCLLAYQAVDAGADALHAFIESFLLSAQEGGLYPPVLLALIWRVLRWPLAAFLFGFSAFGLLGIPVLTGLRGFFLGFSIASFARAYRVKGIAAAFILLGIPAAVSLPAFFLLSVQSFSSAFLIAGQRKRDSFLSSDALIRCGACGAAFIVSLLLEYYLVPYLISVWASVLVR